MLKKINKHILEKLDESQVEKKPEITKHFEAGEVIRFSEMVTKYNDEQKPQERVLVLTNKRLYNFIKNAGIFQSNLRRKIEMKDIQGITVSAFSSQFVIHENKNYDYRFESKQLHNFLREIINRKMLICEYIKQEYFNLMQKQLGFYKIDEANLFEYTTSKKDFKKKISRMPKQKQLYYQGF